MSHAETKAMHAASQARNALQRIEALEKMIPGLISATNNALTDYEGRLTQVAEVTDALVQNVGEDAVNSVLVAQRRTRAAARETAEKKQIADAVAKGDLKVVEKVMDASVLVLKKYGPEGQELEFNRLQASVSILIPPLRAEAIGKAVGHKMQLPGGLETFEITEIYDPVPKAPEAPATAGTPQAAAPAEPPPAAPVPTADTPLPADPAAPSNAAPAEPQQ